MFCFTYHLRKVRNYLLLLHNFDTGKTGPNGIAVTGGGDLLVKHVIHLNVRDKSHMKEWTMAIRSCLDEAERLGLTSLSFPTLGTGICYFDYLLHFHLVEEVLLFDLVCDM